MEKEALILGNPRGLREKLDGGTDKGRVMTATVKYRVNLEEAVIRREAMRMRLGLRGAVVGREGAGMRNIRDTSAELPLLMCSSRRYKWPPHRPRYMRRKARTSQSPTWNQLFTLTIDDREGMDGGGEGTRAQEDNGRREWLSAAAMTFDRGVAIGLRLCFKACAVTN